MNDNPLYEMFSMSGGSFTEEWNWEGLIKAQKTMEVDIFRAVNNLHPKDVHPID